MAELINKTGSSEGVLILHGGSAGVSSSFILKVFELAKEHGLNALAYDFPYLNGEDKKPSPGFKEEIPTVKEALKRLREDGAENIHVIAKSVGSAILSEALKNEDYNHVNRVTIMGLPIGLTDLKNFSGKKLEIVQGSLDRFGGAGEVKNELSKTGLQAQVIEVPGATHSFRDAETDTKPIYEDEAIEKINWSEI